MTRKCICYGERELGIVGTDLSGFSNRIYAYIQEDRIRVFSEDPDGAAGDIQIKYCPMCGRKLEKSIIPLYDLETAQKRAHIRFA
jgi:hypothetical protein